ncbi:MAG: DUF4114 domain-containing protein, partial [Myxococcota bacterium]
MSKRRYWLWAVVVMGGLCASDRSHAFINQADGTVVPVGPALQSCLDGAFGEGMVGAIDAVADAEVTPETYRPVFDTTSMRYRVTFTDIGEGAGFRNSFGWFWIDEDPTNPANLKTIFGCRTYGTCNCPCATTRSVTVDFDLEPGFAVGRGIGFWLRTPERLTGTRENGTFNTMLPYCAPEVGCDPDMPNLNDSCGGRLDSDNRIYFTSQSLNDDGDYVHFLVYESQNITDAYYFGFEDLFRGGDNDYEDMLVLAEGLVPLCTPQPETCDNTDQDCDLNIDEGVTQPCATACGAGVQTCVAGAFGACSAPVPSAEICNNIDDNCNGATDEGLSRACSNACGSGTEICVAGAFANCNAPTPVIETCNSGDDDCDGMVDEAISRACFTACGSGVETCTAGTFGGCTAPVPGAETCDGTDQDCDGLVDEGLNRACSTACGNGVEVCVSGAFVGCNAPAPTVEACNNSDDDCDGMIDEGITRACSSACGVGTETCTAGVFGGCDAPTPMPEVCNNIDDDCNAVIDDGNPGGGEMCVPLADGTYRVITTPMPGEVCTPGRVQCVAGELRCLGASSPSPEVCNCQDDDCDGMIDEEGGDGLCPGGRCVECECASPCAASEFPCPPGRVCDRTLAEPGIAGYCVEGSCAGVECEETESCNPATGECEDLCMNVSCPSERTCIRGACVEDNCYGRGCAVGERCRNAVCEADPCVGVTCEAGQFCRDGVCIGSCSQTCPSGETCIDGACQSAPCGGCADGQSCVDDACVVDACDACGRDRICAGDTCIDDPCQGIECPRYQRCEVTLGTAQCVAD